MDELRTALIEMFAESIGAVDELSVEEETVLDAWNEALPDLAISRADIDAEFI